MEEKRCSKCGEVKAVSEFGKDARSRDGRRTCDLSAGVVIPQRAQNGRISW